MDLAASPILISPYPSFAMSSALSRRLANRRAEATQKLIVFRIGQAQFALPIQAAERVVKLDQLYGAPSGSGLQFTHYQNREILVIDAEQQIFGTHSGVLEQTRSLLPAPRSALESSLERLAPALQDPVLPDSALSDLATLDPEDQSASTALILAPTSPQPDRPHDRPAYLLILQLDHVDVNPEAIGIPLNSPPSLQRVPLTAFRPLPPTYLAAGSIRCVSALIVSKTASEIDTLERSPEPPLFLLNLDLLLQPLSR